MCIPKVDAFELWAGLDDGNNGIFTLEVNVPTQVQLPVPQPPVVTDWQLYGHTHLASRRIPHCTHRRLVEWRAIAFMVVLLRFSHMEKLMTSKSDGT